MKVSHFFCKFTDVVFQNEKYTNLASSQQINNFLVLKADVYSLSCE